MKVYIFIQLLIIISWLSKKVTSFPPESRALDRHDFPDNFVFGTAASAFQYEGATSEGGKSPTIWDYFSHTFPERTSMQNADVAVDFYHRYKDDIKLMKDLNMDAFRFSISWARLIPSIQPSITLYHWDHPQALEDEYGGFLSPQITSQDGQIGIVVSPLWFEPYDSSSPADNEAVKRALVAELDWHLDPVIHGDYPELMKKRIGNRLPSFTREQSQMLKNSSDFIGINYYTARYIAHLPHVDHARPRFVTDQQLKWTVTNQSNHQFGPGEDRGILQSHPEGLRKVLNYIKDKYNNPIVYIKENDNFEWEHGYSTRFGLYYVDYEDNDLTRYPKGSVNWFKQFLHRPVVKNEETEEERVWDVVSREERYNKTFDDSEGFEASVGSILYLMTNVSRREEGDERDRCALGNPSHQLGFMLGTYNSLGL
ncbi:hypothetical protein CARUB_v10025378mg [Capsella rubella]|uniref:Thioglucosidase n=1 Tax=Capsella rubella TaxID=81985 RepID=R0G1J3_9BRAS|nr:hypothetical protein CARUB_v10025378mg [Capsella rubella]